MSNPLFGMIGNNAPNMGGMGNVLQAFQRFRTMFHGDARQQVQALLNSGRISQAQYNQAVQMAQQLQKMINGQ